MNAKSAWFVRWCLLYVIGWKEKECFVICRVFEFDKVGIGWDVRIDDIIFHMSSLITAFLAVSQAQGPSRTSLHLLSINYVSH